MRQEAALLKLEGRLGSQPSAAVRPTGRGIVDIIVLVATLLLFTLSGYALEFLGIPYESLGGSIVTKIHPSTFLLTIALVIAVIANRNPIPYLANLLVRRIGSTLLIVACLLLWYYIHKTKPDDSVSFLFDALIAAGLVSLAMADASETWRTRLSRMLHVLVAANCLIALVEASTSWRLFPFVIAGQEQVWDYRATALFGHPLIGALVTGVYAVILMTVRHVRGLAPRLRAPMILLAIATMPALGSRTSFIVVLAVAAGVLGARVLGFLMGGRLSERRLVEIGLLVPLGVILLAVVVQLGYFDSFLERFSNDSGSAETRYTMFELFDGLRFRDLMTGYDPVELATRVRMEGLTNGVESSWVGHLLHYGLVMALMLWVGIAAWFLELWATGGRGAILPIIFMLLVTSTSVGVSAKTTMLTMPAMLILALIGPAPGTVRPVPGAAVSSRIRRPEAA